MLALALLAALATQDPTPIEDGPGRRPVPEVVEPATPRCRVLGRVLDERGEPVAGVSARLASVGEPWRAGLDVPAEHLLETGEDGRFAFDLPLPDASWVSLLLEPGPYLTADGHEFGPGRRGEPPLFEGDNDLGEITLQAAGAVAGRVLGPGKRPVAEALVMVEGDFQGEYVTQGRTDQQGVYLVGHVAPGSYRLEVYADGLAAADLSIDVTRDRTLRMPPIELAPAATLSARVVDDHGEPLAGAQVCGSPASGGGRLVYAVTGPDGRFIAHLPREQAYRFTVEAEGHRQETVPNTFPGVRLEPGSSDGVIEVPRIATAPRTVRALDDLTGVPVERFGLRVESVPADGDEDGGPMHVGSEPLPVTPVPGGALQVELERAGALVSVEAPGFAPLVARVESDAQQEAPLDLRLRPAGRITGVVSHAGAPAIRATVRLERALVQIDPDLPVETGLDRFFSDNYTFDLDAFRGRARVVTTGADGAFAVEDLAAGTYRLEVRGESGAPLEREALLVAEGELLELGLVELPLAGSVEGRVLAPAGVTVAGLPLQLGEPWDGPSVQVAADGSFRFGGLAEGLHHLRLEVAPGVLAWPLVRPVEVVAGEQAEVQLDLRPLQPVRVRVVVTLNGAPGADAVVSHSAVPGVAWVAAARTDDVGVACFELPPGPDVRLQLVSASGLPLATLDLEGADLPGAELECDLPLACSAVTLEFPPDFELPSQGQADLWVRPEAGEPAQGVHVSLATPGVDHALGIPWTGRRCELGPIAAGSYRIVARVSAYGPSPHGGPGFQPHGAPLEASFTAEAPDGALARLAPAE